MRDPIVLRAPIAASGRVKTHIIQLVRARGFSATARVLFGGTATGNATLEIYYSPDGSNFDTLVYGSASLTVSAGAEVQVSAFVVVPEHGYVQLAVKNEDAAVALDWAKVWYSIQAWPDEGGQTHGRVDSDSEGV